ncbi:MAG: dihydroneopterin aldolase [Desulfocucumaceae bacterium]
MDRIILKGMKFYGNHGVLAHEKELGQVFEVDVELSLDLKPAGASDDLNLSVSYADVFGAVEEVVTGRAMNLIEAVAERIATVILERFGTVREVGITLKKPSAPVMGAFEYMGVQITRGRAVKSFA